jgi:cell division septation protein DedD
MARDYAKKGGQRPGDGKAARRAGKASTSRSTGKSSSTSGWRWYGAGLFTGVFLSFIVYLGTLPPTGEALPETTTADNPPPGEAQPPKPRFDFYKLLPEQSIEVEVEPADIERPRSAVAASELYLLQAGSFRQREDADRRRAELLLLGLDPRIEETSGDNGRWHRVYLGPFDSQAKMAKARSLTAGQGIDTLLLKRGQP